MIGRIFAGVTALFFIIGSAGFTQADTPEETYQEALMKEKGEGDLKEALRLYRKVLKSKDKVDDELAARVQFRIGLCEEKLGLKKAHDEYIKVVEEYPDEKKAVLPATERIVSVEDQQADIAQTERKVERADYVIESFHEEKGVGEALSEIFEKVESSLTQVGREFQNIWSGSRKRYADYAFMQLEIPYPNEVVGDVSLRWKFKLDYGPVSAHEGREWFRKDFDDGRWSEIMIGQAWEDQGYEDYDEGAWYRTTVRIDADKDRPIYMAFGGVDKDGWVYVNGKLVGEHHVWNRPFILDISDAANYTGENVIAIRVYDGEGMGGIYGLITVHQPTGDVETASQYLAGRGGWLSSLATERSRVEVVIRPDIVKPVIVRKSTSRRPYAGYAFTQPDIPYDDYKIVADMPLRWKFTPDHGFGTHSGQEVSGKDFDDSKWSDIMIARAWEDQGYEGYDEGAWYRTTVKIDADKDRPIYMAFGGVDKDGWVYVNGEFVGEHHEWDRPFILDISDAANYTGENTIAIRVYDGMGMGGIYGLINIHQPTGDVRKARRHLVNMEGSGRPSWPKRLIRRLSSSSRERYSSYAFKEPEIPYDDYKVVADVPLKWKFTLDYGPLFGTYDGRKVSKRDFDDGEWSEIMIGRAWEDQGYEGYDEGAWYRTTVKIDADTSRPIYMAFGGVDKDGWVYVNGKTVGEHHIWNRPFILDISDAANYNGENTIAIRVYDGAGMGGIYGLITIHQPTGDVEMSRYLIERGDLRRSRAGDVRGALKESQRRALQRRGEWRTENTGVPPYGHKSVADVPWVWKFKLDPLGSDSDQEWRGPKFDDSKWGDIRIGYPWEQQGYDGYDGMAWYRTKFDMTAAEKKPIYALFRGVADHCWIYLNGKLVGEHHKWDEPFTVELTDAAVHKGENTLAVRVYDQDHTGGIYQPVTIYQMP